MGRSFTPKQSTTCGLLSPEVKALNDEDEEPG